ncbi:MAG: hypothetical protein M3Y73_12245 [Actinomycetota bacterium]|nr:hypothetical protein [Actinomycetota bacterium]
MRKRNLLLVAGACLATLSLTVGSALADPTGAPATRILAGGGSDTTQDVMNALSNVPASGSRIIGSYDATGASPIVIGANGTKLPIAGSDCKITRPVGSKNGVLALVAERAAAAAPNPVRRPCLDFARSSADLHADPAFAGSAGLTFVPFAGDQVSFVTRNDTLLPKNLTKAQLQAIYLCTAPGTISNPPTILPLIPQAGSGTRGFFLQALATNPTDPPITPGSCVSSVDPTDPTKQLIENSGNRLTDPRHIAPYSVGQFNSQYFGVVTPVQGSTELRRINGQIPGSSSFPTEFQRLVYNVIPTSQVNNEPYKSTFVGTGSAVCANTSVITQFGFTVLPSPVIPNSQCGDTSRTTGGSPAQPGAPTN